MRIHYDYMYRRKMTFVFTDHCIRCVRCVRIIEPAYLKKRTFEYMTGQIAIEEMRKVENRH